MYSPKIKEELIPLIYRQAHDQNIPMTKVVNDILEQNLYKIYYCQTCNAEIESEAGVK